MQAAFDPAGLAGVVGFYGSLAIEGQRWVLDRAGEMTAAGARPVRGRGRPHHARADLRVRRRADRAAVEHDSSIYEGAPHSFFDRKQEQYAEQSADAWERILGFISRFEVKV